MRTGLSTIQQTLTPEALTVLNHSIAEANRRNHSQTTPLHVAAMLLSSPSGFLRQACVRSHPHTSHPLQSRALELCFSVALDRLPTAHAETGASAPHDAPVSNALMAALKRAQAHQRRGCPEQQQQPILAVKVELEQLIISILDDPSVSRVMREASFSSPAVKATIEQSLKIMPQMSHVPIPNRNLYMNPRLVGKSSEGVCQRNDEVKRVVDILLRKKKKNPVLVGELEMEIVIKEVLRRIENEGTLGNVEVIRMEKELGLDKVKICSKIGELGMFIEKQIGSCNGVVIDLGDLKWLVEQQEMGQGKVVVGEMGKLVGRFGDEEGNCGLWLIGRATCETYLRCQVYHPTMESQWDLQAVPVASKSPLPRMFPRLGANRFFSSPVESFNSLKSFPTTIQTINCCPQCSENYEQELAKVSANSQVKIETARSTLPQWLHNASPQNGDAKRTNLSQTENQEFVRKHKIGELRKKWIDTCLQLHPNYLRANSTATITGFYNQNLLVQPFQAKAQQTKNLSDAVQLKPNIVTSQHSHSPPRSPVRTDLVLGPTKVAETTPRKIREDPVKNLLDCISSEPETKYDQLLNDKFADALDADSFKKLLKGLMEQAWWQPEAASAVATTVTQCKLGNGRRKGSIWLLFTGPDRIGKKKMACVLSEHACEARPVMISLGSRCDDGELDLSIRGKTVIDRIAEAVRRNPFSVIMLEDVDKADTLVRGSIKQAMERGRLIDSHGREISLGNVIFILTGNWSAMNLKNDGDENMISSAPCGGWQLRLTMGEKTAKRRGNWLHESERLTKPRKKMGFCLSLDLNQTAEADDDQADGSLNSSDVTIDHEDEHVLENRPISITSIPREMASFVDGVIVFKPIDFELSCREIERTIMNTFSTLVDDYKVTIEVEKEALKKIHDGVLIGQVSLREWAEEVLGPTFDQLKSRLSSVDEETVIRLESDTDFKDRENGDRLPRKIRVMVD